MSGIDLNRAGTPLLEIVSEPELRGAKEAVAYARTMHALVRWIGICDGNMQEGSFRCDANVSVRKAGDDKLGTRCEIKNLNSFRFMEHAIEFEARRQIEILEDGGKIVQETRLYDPDKNETRSMRSKEDAQDYRYFPDPDLLPLVISESEIERVSATMPELPEAKRERFVAEFGLYAPMTRRTDSQLARALRTSSMRHLRALDRLRPSSAQLDRGPAERAAERRRSGYCAEPSLAGVVAKTCKQDRRWDDVRQDREGSLRCDVDGRRFRRRHYREARA